MDEKMTMIDETKVLQPQALVVLQSCWKEFAQQNGLSDKDSQDIFAQTCTHVEKKGLYSVHAFATAETRRWPIKMPERLREMICQRAKDELDATAHTSAHTPHYVATGATDEKRQRIGDEDMEVDSSLGSNVQPAGESPSGSSTDRPTADVKMTGNGDASPNSPLEERDLMQIHLVDAIVDDGLIEQRRQKYLARWASTFVGTFRVYPPQVTDQCRNADMLRRVSKFEFFLWSDVTPQPTIDYLKRKIAKATDLKASNFKLATMQGRQLPYDAIAKDAYEKLSRQENLQTADMLQSKPVVDLRIVTNLK